jgi:hypothetical protein
MEGARVVLCICIGFNVDSDPALYLNADSDPDPAFYHNADPNPRSPTNADPCRSGQTLKSLEVNFYMKTIGSQRRYGKKAFLKGRKPVYSRLFPCSWIQIWISIGSAFPIRIRIHNSQLNAGPRGSGSTSLLIRTEKSVCMGIVDPDPVGPGTFFEPVGSVSGMVHSGSNF